MDDITRKRIERMRDALYQADCVRRWIDMYSSPAAQARTDARLKELLNGAEPTTPGERAAVAAVRP